MKIIRHPLFMRPTPESELEQLIDRELRALPPVSAPPDLVSRVLAAAAALERRPWYAKPASMWPAPARFGFLALATSLAAFLVYFTWGLSTGTPYALLADEMAELSGRMELMRSLGGSLAGAGMAVARSAGPWLPWTAAGVVAACYLTTLALGTYCYRLASERI